MSEKGKEPVETSRKEHEVLTSLKKSLGVGVVETEKVTIDKMEFEIRNLNYQEKLSATNMAFAFIIPNDRIIAEAIIKTLFISYSVVSINGIPKPEAMGLTLSIIDKQTWETSHSYSEDLNNRASALIAQLFMEGTDLKIPKQLAEKYEDHFMEIDIDDILDYLQFEADQKKEIEKSLELSDKESKEAQGIDVKKY